MFKKIVVPLQSRSEKLQHTSSPPDLQRSDLKTEN